MMNKDVICEASFGSLIERPLRRSFQLSVHYSTYQIAHPLPGGAADFSNNEKMKGVGQHNNTIIQMEQSK